MNIKRTSSLPLGAIVTNTDSGIRGVIVGFIGWGCECSAYSEGLELPSLDYHQEMDDVARAAGKPVTEHVVGRMYWFVPFSREEDAPPLVTPIHHSQLKLECSMSEMFLALDALVTRCDGEEGVRADGSNIDTTAAHAVLKGWL